MTTTLLGELTVGAIVPQPKAALLAVLAEMQGKLAGAIAAQAQYTLSPPSVGAQLQAANSLIAQLQIDLPTANISLSLMATVIAQLQLQVDLLLELTSAFGVGGILAWRYQGAAGQLGAELGAAVEARVPATQQSQALLLLATAPEAWLALGKVLIT